MKNFLIIVFVLLCGISLNILVAGEKENFWENLSKNLLKEHYRAALKNYHESPYMDSKPEIEPILNALADYTDFIAQSFKDDIGKTVTVETSKGKKASIKIGKIKKGRVYIEEKIGSGTVLKPISLTKLSDKEKLERITGMDDAARNIFSGVIAFRNKNLEKARECFEKGGALSKPLLDTLLPIMAKKLNNEAEEEFKNILYVAGIKEESVKDKAVLNNTISQLKDKLDAKQRTKLKNSIDNFMEKYRGSECEKKNFQLLSNINRVLDDAKGYLSFSTDIAKWGVEKVPWRQIKLSDKKSEPSWKEPAKREGKRMYGTAMIGKTRINAVADILGNNTAKIYLGFGGDVNLSSKKPVLSSDHYPVEFDMTAIEGGTGRYAVVLHYDPKTPDKLYYYNVCIREGQADIEGEKYPLAIMDDFCKGTYSDMENTVVCIDIDRDGQISKYEKFKASSIFKINGAYYKVSKIEPSGGHLEVSKAPLCKINGCVKNYLTMQPMAGAKVSLTGYPFSAFTDSNGKYSMDVPEMSYEMLILAQGYEPSKTIVSTKGKGTELKVDDIFMKPSKASK